MSMRWGCQSEIILAIFVTLSSSCNLKCWVILAFFKMLCLCNEVLKVRLYWPFFCTLSISCNLKCWLKLAFIFISRYDSRNSVLEWSILLIDNSNRRLVNVVGFYFHLIVLHVLLILVAINELIVCANELQWLNGICCASCWFIIFLPYFCAIFSYKYLQWSKGLLCCLATIWMIQSVFVVV